MAGPPSTPGASPWAAVDALRPRRAGPPTARLNTIDAPEASSRAFLRMAESSPGENPAIEQGGLSPRRQSEND